MMPSVFMSSGDGHPLQHGAVSLPGRMPIAELTVCLDTVIALKEADGNAWSSKFLHFGKERTRPGLSSVVPAHRSGK